MMFYRMLPVAVMAYAANRKFGDWSESRFPPKEIPPLPPQPGYKFYAYMGCPSSKIEAIREKQRLLFFAHSISIAQHFAIDRTSFSWFRNGGDQPVVLQLEIREDTDIKQQDLWTDRLLNTPPNPIVPSYIHFWPAIPPEIQRKTDLQVRLHHVVTCDVQQDRKGARCRAVHALFQRFLTCYHSS